MCEINGNNCGKLCELAYFTTLSKHNSVLLWLSKKCKIAAAVQKFKWNLYVEQSTPVLTPSTGQCNIFLDKKTSIALSLVYRYLDINKDLFSSWEELLFAGMLFLGS